MTPQAYPQVLTCDYCGTAVPTDWRLHVCPTCGAQLPTRKAIAARDAQVLEYKLIALNETLLEAGALNAEGAFNLGCWMSVFVIVLVGALTFWLADRNWILVAIAVLTATFVATGVATILALQAKSSAMKRTFSNVVRPEMDKFIQEYNLDSTHFESLAHLSLPEEAPLRLYIPPPAVQIHAADRHEAKTP